MATTRAVVEKAYDHFTKGEAEQLLTQFSPNCTIETNWAGTFTGAAPFFQALGSRFDVKGFEWGHVVVEGENAASWIYITMEGRATGKTAQLRSSHFFKVKDGLIVEFMDLGDSKGLAELPQA